MLENCQSAALLLLVLGEFQEHTVLKTRSFIIAFLASEKLKALFIIKRNPIVVVQTIVEIRIFENNTIRVKLSVSEHIFCYFICSSTHILQYCRVMSKQPIHKL